MVRYTCCSNYEIIRKILKHVWAFSIAMDAGTKASVSYLDVRLRITIEGKLYNLHLVALPMTESHTGENTFLLIAKFLDALCNNWKSKLISVSTDGASNMHGRFQGAVTRLDDVCLPGFYRIWCGAHQLDLVIQSIFVKMLSNSYVERTQAVTGHLRRQQNLIRQMPTKCPKFVDTRWLSMERLLQWLKKHRVVVHEYMDTKNVACKPDVSWWIMVYILLDFTEVVNITFRQLQGMTTLVESQSQMLKNLAANLQLEGHVLGPLQAVPEACETNYINDFYFATHAGAEEYIQNRELFVREHMAALKLSHNDKYTSILSDINVMYVDAVAGILRIMVERDTTSTGTSTLPSVLPKRLLDFTRAQFGDILMIQKERLKETFADQEIVELENEFKLFKNKSSLEKDFRSMIEKTDDQVTFEEA